MNGDDLEKDFCFCTNESFHLYLEYFLLLNHKELTTTSFDEHN